MYAALWRVLPGPAWAKAGQLLVLLVLTVAVLFTWVFPVVSRLLPSEDVTVPDPAQFTTSTTTGRRS
jgi:hypothetical protein